MTDATKSSKRHESLIPLSREHHYGLLLSVQIRKGLLKKREDPEWLKGQAENAVQFFLIDLIPHFKAEEEALFPEVREFRGGIELVMELLSEHRMLENTVKELGEAEGSSLANKLDEFAERLEKHIRKEERMLFPLYQSNVSVDAAKKVEEELARRLGDAMKPRRPDLLGL